MQLWNKLVGQKNKAISIVYFIVAGISKSINLMLVKKKVNAEANGQVNYSE